MAAPATGAVVEVAGRHRIGVPAVNPEQASGEERSEGSGRRAGGGSG